jgi:hypothetical protein
MSRKRGAADDSLISLSLLSNRRIDFHSARKTAKRQSPYAVTAIPVQTFGHNVKPESLVYDIANPVHMNRNANNNPAIEIKFAIHD